MYINELTPTIKVFEFKQEKGDKDFTGLSEEETEKYENMFRYPQSICFVYNKLVAAEYDTDD